MVFTEVPKTKRGFRDPDFVDSVILRMGIPFIKLLDDLCKANGRSRREIVEMLVTEAAIKLETDAETRITPV